MKKKNNENSLDFVPKRNSDYAWKKNKNGIVVVDIVHKGFFNWIAQKIFKRPRISHIKLDPIGSYNWELIDGERTIYEISEKVKEKFGEKAEPLYERQIQFFKILLNNNFVKLIKEKK